MDTADSKGELKPLGKKTVGFFTVLTFAIIGFGILGYLTMPKIPLEQAYPECFNEDGSLKGTCTLEPAGFQVYIYYGVDYIVSLTYDEFNNITEYLVSKT